MLMTARPSCETPRRVKMPVHEPSEPNTSVSANIPALKQFFKASRDTMDFGIDFTDWLFANGGTQLTDAEFVEGADSPQSPTIAGQDFSPTGEVVVVISGGNPGDAYYLDCVATVDAVQVRDGNPNPIMARTITRRIHVVVYKD